jgi:PAS domain S-box-containing protein
MIVQDRISIFPDERSYTSLFGLNKLPMIFYETNNGIVLDINKSASDHLQTPVIEAKGNSIDKLFNKDLYAGVAKHIKLNNDGIVPPISFFFKTNNLNELTVTVSIQEAFFIDKECIWLTITSITNEDELGSFQKDYLVNKTNHSVLFTNPDRLLIWANSAFENLTEFTLEEARGKNPGQLLQGKKPDENKKVYMRNMLEKREPFKIEIVNYTKSRKKYWQELEIKPVYDQLGDFYGFMAVQTDISSHKNLLKKLAIVNEQFETFLNHSSMIAYMKDLDGNYIYVNNEYLKVTGQEEISKGANIKDFFAETRSLIKRATIKEIVNKDKGHQIDIFYKDQVFLDVCFPVKDEKGIAYAIGGFCMNVTESRLIEKKKLEAQNKYKLLFENIGDAILICTRQGKVVSANPSACKVFQLPLKELLTKKLDELFDTEDIFTLESLKSMKEQLFYKGDLLCRTKDKTQVTFEAISTYYLNNEEEVRNIIILRDYSEIKQYQKVLHKANQLYKSLINSQTNLLVRFNISGAIIFFNKALLNLIEHYSEKGGKKNTISYYIHPDDLPLFEDQLKYCLLYPGKITKVALRFLHDKVKYIEWEIICLSEQEEGQNIFQAVGHDITERIQAEERIKESEEKFRSIANSTPVFIWLTNIDKEVIYFNEPWFSFTGRTPEEEYNLGWFDGVHPDDKSMVLEKFSIATQEVSEYVVEYRHRRRDGEFRWILTKAIPNFSLNGEFKGYIGTCIDITEKKEQQEKIANSERIFSAFFNSTNENIIILDSYMNIISFNKKAQDTIKTLFREEVQVGDPFLKYSTPESRSGFLENFNRALAGEEVSLELLIHHAENLSNWYSFKYVPLKDQKGEVFGVGFTSMNIDSKKKAELELQEMATNMKSLLESTNDRIWAVDTEMKVIYYNSSLGKDMVQLHGKVPPNGTLLQELVIPENYLKLFNMAEESFDGKKSKIQMRYGAVVFEIESSPIFEKDEIKGVVFVAREISELIKIQREISQSEANLKALIESTDDMIISFGKSGKILYSNSAFQSLLKQIRNEELDTPESIKDFFHLIPKEVRNIWKKIKSEVMIGNPVYNTIKVNFNEPQDRYYDLNFNPIIDQESLLGFTIFIREITVQKLFENELEHRKDLLEKMGEVSKAGAWEYNLETQEMIWTDQVYKIYGLEIGSEVNAGIGISHYPDSAGEKIAQLYQKCIENHQSYDVELPFVSASGQEKWIRTTGNVRLREGVPVAVYGLFQDITRKKEYELGRLTAQIEGQELERARISRELHDGLGQLLNAIKINFNLDEDGSSRFRISMMIDEAIQETSRISENLLPAKLRNFNLHTCIHSLCKTNYENSRTIINFESSENIPDDLDQAKKINLYRITQEAISNALKYAHASMISVQLYFITDSIILTIEDDGKGFDLERIQNDLVKNHHGLQNMIDRVEIMNGRIDIESRPNMGTVISVQINI